MSLLHIDQLSIHFAGQPAPAVDNVSLRLDAGEMLALVGESGSGKSLTAQSILRLLPPQADWQCQRLSIAGEEVSRLSDSRLRGLRGGRVGMIFQEPLTALNPLHKVEKQLSESLRIHQGLGRQAARQRCIQLLQQVQLPDPETFLNRYPHQLSGGQRQRVCIALALANNPQLLIADEPTTALDVTIQAEIMTLLKQLQQELNLAILFISHDIGLVKRYAEQVAVMQAGRVVESGPCGQVMASPTASYTRELLAAEPASSAPKPLSDRQPLLRCDDLSVRFPLPSSGWFRKRYLTAVDNANIEVAQGETLGIVGESGSGKSTLAMALLRLQTSTGGIQFQQQSLADLKGKQLTAKRRQLQVVFQDPFGSLNPRLTVAQLVAEGLRVHEPGLTRTEIEQRVAAQLEEVGLTAEMRHRYAHEFSGGQRQRIAIARALILRPKLVILDEPTSALDRSIQFQLVALLSRLQQEHGLSYIFISHDLKLVRSLSHRLVVMQSGRLVESGDTESIFSEPSSPYTRQLIDAAFQ